MFRYIRDRLLVLAKRRNILYYLNETYRQKFFLVDAKQGFQTLTPRNSTSHVLLYTGQLFIVVKRRNIFYYLNKVDLIRNRHNLKLHNVAKSQ